ncbi:MAG: hypothetical protein HKN24_02880 [Acidimicrobiales bacterium]|nr:hypothetical protein [Acidimicrobiales bacterium]
MNLSRSGLSGPTRRGRRNLLAVLALMLVAAIAAAVAPAAAAKGTGAAEGKPVYEPRLERPDSPNPYQSFLPNAQAADYAGWNLYLNAAGKTRASREAPGSPRNGLRVIEQEPLGASTNDTQVDAEFIPRFGTSTGKNPAASILGTAPDPGGVASVIESAEPDGALDLATEVVLAVGDSATGGGVIGDEATPPDFDFFKIPGLLAGQQLIIDTDTPEPFADLDSFVAVWNPDLAPFEIAANDDGDPSSFDSFLAFTVPVDGDYFVSVGGFGAFVPEDPTNPASPSVTGEVGSEGGYDLTLSVREPAIDFYSFDLKAGDIVGATVVGAGVRLELLNDAGTLLIGSSQDITFIHPPVSPLPGGGNASASYVVEADGRYALSVGALGNYAVDLRVFRPAKERSGTATQTVFIDFDGASIDPGIFQGGEFGFEVELSPLAGFLPAWGLTAGDEDAVIDAILAVVEENLSHDIREQGNNGDRDHSDGPNAFDVEILNSRDHDDPWGDRFVSRLIVGGTIDELQIPTIGIAQSIDVGDFESEETAVTLLDLMAGVGPFPAPDVDLNNFPRDPSASIIDLIGVAVGNITAHEGGHFFSNWHTDQFNDNPNIQDQGGNFPGIVGAGDDGIFGTADDVDVDFGKDVFVPNEGFSGLEDTLQTISFGLSTGEGRGR